MRDQTNNNRTPTDDDHPSSETDKQSDKAANHAEIFLMRQQRGTKQMTRHYEDFREDEAFDENAEDIVRPEPAFYSHVIERLAANPSMCLRALQCPLQIARSPVLDRSALA